YPNFSSHLHPKFSPVFLSPVSASDTTELIGAVGGSVTFRTQNTDRSAALWTFGNEAIVTVIFGNLPQPVFFQEKFQTRFAISESGRALSITPLRMEDAGTYSVIINGLKSTFILHVYEELAEPRVSCEAQNCSGGSCSFSLRCSAPGAGLGNVSYVWSAGHRPWGEGPELLWGNESSRDAPGPLTCMARNPVSSRNVTVTEPAELCAG
ncbi:SLAF7 protein, partial [Phainopepla nitens]|nr:SLAF7 protein [Phainopepla nitens]